MTRETLDCPVRSAPDATLLQWMVRGGQRAAELAVWACGWSAAPTHSTLADQNLALRCGHTSETGPCRAANEDLCFADVQRGLMVVADGMGGYCGGQRASQFVVEAACEVFPRETSCNASTSAAGAAVEAQHSLDRLVGRARQRMIEHAVQFPECSRMGAAFVLALVRNRMVLLAHMGDCRAYLLSRGGLRQLTRDDTAVQAMIDAGLLTPEHAARHPMRHLLINSLGIRSPERWPRVEVYALEPGDRLLMSTDGLTNVLSDKTLRRWCRRGLDPQETAETLAAEAIRCGSRDNVSCLVADFAVR